MTEFLSRRKPGLLASSYGAFTLVELLITISIILILTALIATSSIRAKEAARKSRCDALLRHFYVLIRMYADDNADRLARYDYFATNTSLICPSDETKGAIGVFAQTSFRFGVLFGTPERLDTWPPNSWVVTEDRPFHDFARKPAFQAGQWRGRFNTLLNDGSVSWPLLDQ